MAEAPDGIDCLAGGRAGHRIHSHAGARRRRLALVRLPTQQHQRLCARRSADRRRPGVRPRPDHATDLRADDYGQRPHTRSFRPLRLEPRDLRGARDPAVVRGGRRGGGRGREDGRSRGPDAPGCEGPPRRPRAQGGRRGRRLHGARHSRSLPRARVLLARGRSRARVRRRDVGLQPGPVLGRNPRAVSAREPRSRAQPPIGTPSGRARARPVCFGHGPPVRDTAKFVSAVERLPN